MSTQRNFQAGDRVRAKDEAASRGLIGTVLKVKGSTVYIKPDDTLMWQGSNPGEGYTINATKLEFLDWGSTLQAQKSSLSRLRHGGRLV